MIPVYIFASDRYLWALRVMLRLYERYWGWPCIVYGFTPPSYPLPDCARFVSMGDFADYPAGRWSDAVLGAIQASGDRFAVVMLEDYWLTRRVNLRNVSSLAAYVMERGDVGRGDLTSDRLYAENLVELGPYDALDIIGNDPPPQYTFSTQASIWRMEALKDSLIPGESAWESELNGNRRFIDAGWRAVGTRQMPVRYVIGVQGGKLALMGGYQVPAPKWKDSDLADVVEIIKEEGMG